MATTEDTTVSLTKLFIQGQEMQQKIENSQMNSNSAEYQVNVVYSNILVQRYWAFRGTHIFKQTNVSSVLVLL